MSLKNKTSTGPMPTVTAPEFSGPDEARMSAVVANQQQWADHAGTSRRHAAQAKKIRQEIERLSGEIARLNLAAQQEEHYAQQAASTADAFAWILGRLDAQVPDLPAEDPQEPPGQQAWPPAQQQPVEAAAQQAVRAGLQPYTSAWQDPAPTGVHQQADRAFQAFQAAHDEQAAVEGGGPR